MKKTNARRAGGGFGSLRGRMTLAMLLSAAIVLPAVLLALLYIRRMNDAVNRIVSEDIELMHVGDRIALDFAEARREERNYLLFRDSVHLARGREAIARVAELADRGRELEPGATAEYDALTRLAAGYDRLLDSLTVLTDARREPPMPTPQLARLRRTHERLLADAATTPDSARRDSLLIETDRLAEGLTLTLPAARGLEDTLQVIQQELLARSGGIVARALERVETHRGSARRLATWGQRNIVTVLLLTIAALAWLLATLPRRAVLPIKRITNALRRTEDGDLDVRVTLATNDELGGLARQLNRAFALLREFDERKVERILQLERRFRLVISDISEAVIVVDKTPAILLANGAAEELLGRPAAEAQGRKLNTCPALGFLLEPLEKVLAGSAGARTCEILSGLPGSAVCIEALRNRAGEIVGALIVISNPHLPEAESPSPPAAPPHPTPGKPGSLPTRNPAPDQPGQKPPARADSADDRATGRPGRPAQGAAQGSCRG
ncbi:MAG TPA: HAMP domain-containing protein [candidate division WOR-3 bacterium]|uniref:histidine kinase n=1 Tax=candidate division WOR-3 bacterium TaxID=2052148 RepID=A0A7V0T3V0_UNCW3|nr:HAMP domain-containing protein [candidate division WOR-3 bacterium]